MTRDEKIAAFLAKHSHWLRWCKPTPIEKRDPSVPAHLYDMCACRGCINGSGAYDWKYMHPDEPKITEEEFNRISPEIPRDSFSGTISFDFKGR
jgi:hypothetical protein